MKKINCFIPYQDPDSVAQTIASLRESTLTGTIYLLYTQQKPQVAGCETIQVDNMQSTQMVRQIAERATGNYTLIYTKATPLQLGQFALERLLHVADDSGAGMVYADYYQLIDGERKALPVIDYQQGSVRDDFNFGSVQLYCSKALREAVGGMQIDYEFAGLYDLRLRVSQRHEIFHLNEFLYTEIEDDKRKSGEKQFDYVDPKNRAVQLEMEQACTEHLKQIGAYREPDFKTVDFDEEIFPVEASVIIPVRNRVKTIADAIQSVLSQETKFVFNLIIIDNHSTDGTTELIAKFAKQDERIIHLIPARQDLGIGGCWNEGVHHAGCGKFAVQLDSDDVYSSPATLQTMVDAFYTQQCAMVIGSYTMTNFAMQTIPPGLIDHKEWTPENGRNNALRINGLGAPRAFYTPVLREIKVPNTSYGEDYALGLRISREYQIGRVYQSVYLCRRWDENSDAALDIAKINTYNTYKDKLRTLEMEARKQLNR
ncbi:MAG: glycosyltransferase [Paludibacteraceae bacterium]|nr:glycosyltransferase [Paludibacteraceae bacterium]